jgi:hypothetical protein
MRVEELLDIVESAKVWWELKVYGGWNGNYERKEGR